MSVSHNLVNLGADGRATFLIHPSMYGERNAHPREVYCDLDRVVQTNLRYHYTGPICAHRWLEQCEDPAYGHVGLLSRVDDYFPNLLEALRDDCGGLSKIALTSLGPGDGSVDERILRNLDAHLQVTSYCGLDFSFDLLRHAMHRIANCDGLRCAFPVKMICGDFSEATDESLTDEPDRSARLFTLTGLTLGNYKESDLLTCVGNQMRDSDYLLLDARLHDMGARPANDVLTPSERETILGGYDRITALRFAFGPVEIATSATVDDVEIGHDVARAVTAVPNAINIVVYCTGLNTTMRLTGEPVHRARLDLAATTLYHYPDLVAWFGTTGFIPVWHRDMNGIGMFLLRRA